jgi:hypothetical protein
VAAQCFRKSDREQRGGLLAGCRAGMGRLDSCLGLDRRVRDCMRLLERRSRAFDKLALDSCGPVVERR